MRGITRVEGVSMDTITRLLRMGGVLCLRHHNETVNAVAARYIQCDEVWSYLYAPTEPPEHQQPAAARRKSVDMDGH